MDVFGPGIGSSLPRASAIYKSLTSLQIACTIGIFTYFWIVDFPENAEQSFHFMDKEETELAVKRIHQDRGDVIAAPFSWHEVLPHFRDPKITVFAVLCFLQVRMVFLRACVIEDFSKKTASAVESCHYQPWVLFTNNVSVSRGANYFSTNTAKKHMCSLKGAMGFSVNKSILLAAPVSILSRTPSHGYH